MTNSTRHSTIASIVLVLIACTPIITSVLPDRGPQTGGTQVTLTGSNFSNSMTAQFGSNPATVASVTPGGAHPDVATLISPPGVGTVPITVTTASGASQVTGAAQFLYIKPAWGFADLHSHPASHLAFGADSNGQNGIFWGSPGLALDTAATTLASDLRACATDTHSGFTLDLVQHETRKSVISRFDTLTMFPHGADGAPTFQSWPAALSLEHQQMHITAIKRAYDGGLRLLVASVTDNQLLGLLWHNSILACLSGIPPPDGGFDSGSATTQLNFIKSLATSNSSWMQIVHNSAEARQAADSNRLAVVLGTEMDSLTYPAIMSLQAAGVRSVIPIHLADNSFGGSAIYGDEFNTNTQFLNGKFFSVTFDPTLSFRLGPPMALQCSNGHFANPATPVPLPPETTNYTQGGSAGHVNAKGLVNKDQFLDLMRAGLILDIAHMSQASAEMAIGLAESYHYPLIDSHTALRDGQTVAPSERDLLSSHAGRLAKLGGMIGVGTAKNSGPDPVEQWLKDYQAGLAAMGGVGVAIGTDANGFSPQIVANPSRIRTSYPIAIAASFNPPVTTTALPQFQLGARTFDIADDGIANYGLLPDFLQAVSERPDFGQTTPNPTALPALRALYHSAEDFIVMWEKAEQAASNMNCPQPSEFCGGVCKNTTADRDNCGACGHQCPASFVCKDGGCSPQCTGGSQLHPYPWCGQSSPTVIECPCPTSGETCKRRCGGELCTVDWYCQ